MTIFVIRRLIRIYTPFICALVSLIHGVLFFREELTAGFIYNASFSSGFSIIVIGYFWATSKQMCIWWHLNLLCLALISVSSALDYYKILPIGKYFYFTTLLSTFGLIFFLLYRNTVGITKFLRIN